MILVKCSSMAYARENGNRLQQHPLCVAVILQQVAASKAIESEAQAESAEVKLVHQVVGPVS